MWPGMHPWRRMRRRRRRPPWLVGRERRALPWPRPPELQHPASPVSIGPCPENTSPGWAGRYTAGGTAGRRAGIPAMTLRTRTARERSEAPGGRGAPSLGHIVSWTVDGARRCVAAVAEAAAAAAAAVAAATRRRLDSGRAPLLPPRVAATTQGAASEAHSGPPNPPPSSTGAGRPGISGHPGAGCGLPAAACRRNRKP